MNGFSVKCFGLQRRENGFGMKTYSEVGACLIVFSVVLIFIFQDTALDSITRFATTSFSDTGISFSVVLSYSLNSNSITSYDSIAVFSLSK